MIPMILKPAYNDEFRTFDFSPQLTDGETLSAVDVKIYVATTGTDATADMISDVAIYDQTQVRYRLKGGTAEQIYRRVFRVTTSNGQKLEDEARVMVV